MASMRQSDRLGPVSGHVDPEVVVVERVVVEQRQSMGPSQDRYIGDVVGAAVAPADLLWVLLGRVLGVLDHQVGIGDPLDQASVANVNDAVSEATADPIGRRVRS